MAHVYAYMEKRAPRPIALEMAELIDRFGAQAVMGRPLYTNELKDITCASMVCNAYKSRERSKDWAKWSGENPELAEVLDNAMKAADGIGY